MSKFLITQTLLNSWGWIYKADSGYEDFIKTLNREPLQLNEAMLNGRQFENLVTAYTKGEFDEKHKWANGIRQVGDVVKGGQLQIALSTVKKIGGADFVLYGILDALKSGIIYDIKFSKSYEVGKYIDSPQHPMYLEICPEAREFTYLISDGEWLYTETYTRETMLHPIDREIEHFIRFLKSNDLCEIFKKKWISKY